LTTFMGTYNIGETLEKKINLKYEI